MDRIFAGNLDGLPPLSSKVHQHQMQIEDQINFVGCADLHKLHLHRHVDGEEHTDGIRLPQDQGVLPGEARARVPGGGHALGCQGRDD